MGVLLVDFLRLFGRSLNNDDVGISCSKGGYFYNKLDAQKEQPMRPYMLSVEDPADPDNDLSRGSWNFLKVFCCVTCRFPTSDAFSTAGDTCIASTNVQAAQVKLSSMKDAVFLCKHSVAIRRSKERMAAGSGQFQFLPHKLSVAAAILSMFVLDLQIALTEKDVYIVAYTVMYSSELTPHKDPPSSCYYTMCRDHATTPPLHCHMGSHQLVHRLAACHANVYTCACRQLCTC